MKFMRIKEDCYNSDGYWVGRVGDVWHLTYVMPNNEDHLIGEYPDHHSAIQAAKEWAA